MSEEILDGCALLLLVPSVQIALALSEFQPSLEKDVIVILQKLANTAIASRTSISLKEIKI